MIETRELTKDYGKNRGVFSLDLLVEDNSIYGFVGPNGAGKTTTIKILCGLLKPDGGEAFIDEVKVEPKNIAKIKKRIGYMPDITGVYEQMSVWEFLDFYGAAFKIPPKQRKKRIEEVLETTSATEMIDYQMTSLSRGMRQKVALAKTIIHDPSVLILDEPAGGLDPKARIEMRETIKHLRDLGKTILLSSHILPELASICDRVGIIFKGKLLAQGAVKEISHQLCESLVVEITVDFDIQEAAALLKHVDGVDNVTPVDNSQIRFVFNGTREQVGSILSALIQNGVRVRWFKEDEADLENVFMDITGQSTD